MISFVWLAFLVGPSFLAGLLVMFLMVPCQAMILITYMKCQMQRLKLTDQRVKLNNEMVQGMRVIKMYSWEKTIGLRVGRERVLEGQRDLALRPAVQARADEPREERGPISPPFVEELLSSR